MKITIYLIKNLQIYLMIKFQYSIMSRVDKIFNILKKICNGFN